MPLKGDIRREFWSVETSHNCRKRSRAQSPDNDKASLALCFCGGSGGSIDRLFAAQFIYTRSASDDLWKHRKIDSPRKEDFMITLRIVILTFAVIAYGISPQALETNNDPTT